MEDNEIYFWLRLWGVIAICVTMLLIAALLTFNYRLIRMAELGYQAVSYQGSERTYYQKIR